MTERKGPDIAPRTKSRSEVKCDKKKGKALALLARQIVSFAPSLNQNILAILMFDYFSCSTCFFGQLVSNGNMNWSNYPIGYTLLFWSQAKFLQSAKECHVVP